MAQAQVISPSEPLLLLLAEKKLVAFLILLFPKLRHDICQIFYTGIFYNI